MKAASYFWLWCFVISVVESFTVPSSLQDRCVCVVRSASVAELREELQSLQVDFSDCFDKESLAARLQEAKTKSASCAVETNNKNDDDVDKPTNGPTPSATNESTTNTAPTPPSTTPPQTTTTTTTLKIDKDKIQSLTIKELRAELASRNIRWGGLLEKADLVRAVVEARQVAATFSATGLLLPGQVTELNEEQVQQELQHSTTTPLLLDCFATWCGPCQLVKKELKEAAQTWQDRLRVVAMDTDQNPNLSRTYSVEGLPTLILFKNGQEVDRMEGALSKEQLLKWVDL